MIGSALASRFFLPSFFKSKWCVSRMYSMVTELKDDVGRKESQVIHFFTSNDHHDPVQKTIQFLNPLREGKMKKEEEQRLFDVFLSLSPNKMTDEGERYYFLSWMKSKGIGLLPTSFTFSNIVRIASSREEMEYICSVLPKNYEEEPRVISSFILAYSRLKCVHETEMWLGRFEDQIGNKCGGSMYGALLLHLFRLYSHTGALEKGIKRVKEMKSNTVDPVSQGRIFSYLVRECRAKGKMKQVLSLYHLAKEKKMKVRTKEMYLAWIEAASLENLELVIGLEKEMKEKGIKMDCEMYEKIIWTRAHLGSPLVQVVELYSKMEIEGMKASRDTLLALIKSAGMNSCSEVAFTVFSLFIEGEVYLASDVYIKMMEAMALCGDFELVFALYQDMKERKIPVEKEVIAVYSQSMKMNGIIKRLPKTSEFVLREIEKGKDVEMTEKIRADFESHLKKFYGELFAKELDQAGKILRDHLKSRNKCVSGK